ncbi:hypothetical protein GCM10009785_00180 [Brooklawnia cerclae]|uniref:Uncharacterized protein n=1 Tax=Brooklawnia cerclae TaxID=349934 RepID=A0ABX0SN83_9ACTN|nr:hypothetical protein [Brooklawnia cerclae]NIH58500.1 hypothetical protein [Brooklawnia cerclae]
MSEAQPMAITAFLTSAVVALERGVILDGPLSFTWAALATQQGRVLPPIRDDFVFPIPMPFQRWEIDGTWGWCCSKAHERILKWTAVEVRRKPATEAMALFTVLPKHHAGLGPTKARNTTLSARIVSAMRWNALVTDPDELCRLLAATTSVSARWRNGFGHVARWVVEPSHEPDGWRDRPLPAPGGEMTPVRPPYWHRTTWAPCSAWSAA